MILEMDLVYSRSVVLSIMPPPNILGRENVKENMKKYFVRYGQQTFQINLMFKIDLVVYDLFI